MDKRSTTDLCLLRHNLSQHHDILTCMQDRNQFVMSRGSLLSVSEQNEKGTSVSQVQGIPFPA